MEVDSGATRLLVDGLSVPLRVYCLGNGAGGRVEEA